MVLNKIKGFVRNSASKTREAYRQLPARLNNLRNLWPADYRELNELIVIALLVVLLAAAVIFSPWDIPRIILGLPFVLFLPGYTLLAAIYVRKDRMSGPVRFALSFGMSAAVVPLIGLFLNYTVGISLPSFFVVTSLFMLAACLVAWIRRGRTPEKERFTVHLRFSFRLSRKSVPNVVLGLAALAAAGSVVYVIAEPKIQEGFTEFYISGVEEQAVYPEVMAAGIEQKIAVTIVNRERRTLTYLMEVKINGEPAGLTGPLVLEQGREYSAETGFTPPSSGDRQLVEFILYLEGESDPYLEPLQLWVDVK